MANIVAGGNSATQSLSDAFATANQEFGMADRLIGGYQVTDQVPNSKKEEEEPITDTLSEEVKPAWSVDQAQIIDLVNGQNIQPCVYQLSLLSDMQPVATGRQAHYHISGHYQNDHHQNGPPNGHHQNSFPNGHHQNGTSATHTRKNGHLPSSDERKRLIGVPQLEMALGNDYAKSSRKGSKKRRRKAYRGPSLFDWLNSHKA